MPELCEWQTYTSHCGCVMRCRGTGGEANWVHEAVTPCEKHADGSCVYCDKMEHRECGDCGGSICKGGCLCDMA